MKTLIIKKMTPLVMLLMMCLSPLLAQDLYEVKFTASNITYKGLLVYFSENDIYMRVAYTHNGEYKVVNVEYEALTGNEDGMNYLILLGSDAEFVTETDNSSYNPDHFFWIWEGDEPNSLPLTTDDPNFDIEKMVETESFKALEKGSVTDSYLREFYWSNEEDYYSFRKLFGLDQDEYSEYADYEEDDDNYIDEDATLHLVIAANTYIGDIGGSCSVDQRNLVSEFKGITESIGIDYKEYIVNGDDFTKANLSNTLSNLKPSENDIVIFIYRGHGYRWSNQTGDWPQLDMRYSSYTPINDNTSLGLAEVYNTIVKKGARLNIVIGDCCNSDVGISRMTNTSFLTMQSYHNPNNKKLKRLFLEAEGNLLATSASPGEVSWANNVNGGFFTVSFLQALRSEISYLEDDTADWKELVNNAISYAKHKSSPRACSNCTQQNGIYYHDIKY